jgi:hypothetical protein
MSASVFHRPNLLKKLLPPVNPYSKFIPQFFKKKIIFPLLNSISPAVLCVIFQGSGGGQHWRKRMRRAGSWNKM